MLKIVIDLWNVFILNENIETLKKKHWAETFALFSKHSSSSVFVQESFGYDL